MNVKVILTIQVIQLHLIVNKDNKLKFYSLNEFYEGCIFGQNFGFEVSIDHTFRPHITTNQCEFDLGNSD
jgi:hypothetical protein